MSQSHTFIFYIVSENIYKAESRSSANKRERLAPGSARDVVRIRSFREFKSSLKYYHYKADILDILNTFKLLRNIF